MIPQKDLLNDKLYELGMLFEVLMNSIQLRP